MSFTHTITQEFRQGNLPAISSSVNISADAEDNREIPVAGTTTDKQVDMALDVSSIQSLFLLSDQDVTIETNDGSSPADTISLVANKPVSWYSGCGYACPLGTDVTALFLTNAGATAATVQIRCLKDSTP